MTEEIKTVNQALSESDSKNQILRRCLLWGLVLIVLLALLFLAIKFIEQQGQGDSQSYAAAEALAGRLIESGIIPAQIDYQDPVLTESRTIIITQEINEKVAGEICSKLIYLDRLDPKEPINLVIKTGEGCRRCPPGLRCHGHDRSPGGHLERRHYLFPGDADPGCRHRGAPGAAQFPDRG